MRVGIGYDIHRLVRGRRLLLGGIEVPHPKGLMGHSDGDVLLHAVIDAMLGAAGLGDIGELFPDSDPDIKGIPSSKMIAEAGKRLSRKGLRVANVDAVIVIERPRLSALKERIRASVARLVKVPTHRVNIKAKTHERMGDIGQGRAIAAYCVVSLKSK